MEELCGELGVPFAETRLTVEDCRNAEEAMLAGTSYCLAGVAASPGGTCPGRGRALALLDAWGRRVGVDLERQILSNP